MANIDISKLDDKQLNELVNNRWKSSSTIWDIVERIYKQNTAIYENRADWLTNIPYRRQTWRVQANRIFVDMEAVINSLIANPPGINVLPAREGEEAQEFASKLENYFRKKYEDLNIKEVVRMAYRNLYFSRLLVIKPFWNPNLGEGGDFDFRTIDSRKVRFGKYARKEQDTEFAIEEIEDNLCSVIERFPKKKNELLKKYGIADDQDLYIKNPDVKYKEAWINEYVIFKLENIILDVIKNPYWDWEGILVTQEEEKNLQGAVGDARREMMQQIKMDQEQRQAQQKQLQQQQSQQGQPQDQQPQQPTQGQQQPAEQMEVPQEQPMQQLPTLEEYRPYMFNYFDNPRKPYIFATVFNNENSPIGRTDMISLASELQRGIDKRKMDIDENCEMVNGMLKVDASVMGKSDAQRIRFETKGIIWGKGVKDGVTRETGPALPAMVFEDMQDSREEIDNIMAASSAFKGVREGAETKAGRLALIQQSFLRLNELVQVGDYVAKEIFDWGMQLAKTRYTEYHYAKWMGKEDSSEIIELIQDDFETGTEVKIIAGKSLPEDDEFKFNQAQNDVKEGFISPVDYLRIAKYEDYQRLAKNAVEFKINPVVSVGVTPEEQQKLQPPQNEEKPPNVTINYADLTPDAQVQLLEKIGIQADPNVIIAEKIAEHKQKQVDMGMKIDAQKHAQTMAEKSHQLSQEQLNKPQKNAK